MKCLVIFFCLLAQISSVAWAERIQLVSLNDLKEKIQEFGSSKIIEIHTSGSTVMVHLDKDGQIIKYKIQHSTNYLQVAESLCEQLMSVQVVENHPVICKTK